jgi:predicted nucleotidyltransferase
MSGVPNHGTTVPNLGTTVPNLRTVEAPTLLADALFGNTRRQVLGLLMGHPDQSFYTRQIARILHLGLGALHRELQSLVEAGILMREAHGQQIYYRVNTTCPIYTELHGLLLKTAGLGDVLRSALAGLADRITVAFVYGSLAKGAANGASDVDVMVIGSITLGEVAVALNPTQDTLKREVNPSVYPPEELRSKLQNGNHFLTTVLAEPKLFLIGSEDDLNRLVA